MKIAICDDEREFLENVGLAIETYLNEKGLEYNIDLYNSGKVIMELRENIVSYDVVFLDINMPEVSGLEVAEWIRTYSDNVNIVFITAIISYAIQGYKYNAVRYILKNERQLKASIYECMDAVLYNMNYRGIDKRVFICNHKEKEVIINKVMYIESSAHKVMFHIDGKESDDYVTNNKLNDIEKTLKDCEYMIRVHQSYMVNMMYVKKVIINKVMYIESSAHKVMFHIDGKESDDYVTNNKLNDIEKTLKDCEYMIRVHQSYMVNMMYVKKVSGYRIYLKNGEEIGVPKPRYKEVKKTIMEFKAII